MVQIISFPCSIISIVVHREWRSCDFVNAVQNATEAQVEWLADLLAMSFESLNFVLVCLGPSIYIYMPGLYSING